MHILNSQKAFQECFHSTPISEALRNVLENEGKLPVKQD
jgi:hypothetical protein